MGHSPSIQIREEALRFAYQNGIATGLKDNNEIAIAIRPDFLVEYVLNIDSLHSIGESTTDYEILEEVTSHPEQINDLTLENISEERKIAVSSVRMKIRDNSFKSRVLTSYSNTCAFCGIQLKLIDAAHIIPVQHDSSDETCNVISLCALHHRAYDRNLVTFNRDYQILINDKQVKKLTEIGLDGGYKNFAKNLRAVITLPPTITDRPHVDYIDQANQIRGW